MSKYHAKRTACAHGHTHASGREAKRCAELHLLLRAGHISVPHPKKDLGTGLVHKLLKQAGLKGGNP